MVFVPWGSAIEIASVLSPVGLVLLKALPTAVSVSCTSLVQVLLVLCLCVWNENVPIPLSADSFCDLNCV